MIVRGPLQAHIVLIRNRHYFVPFPPTSTVTHLTSMQPPVLATLLYQLVEMMVHHHTPLMW